MYSCYILVQICTKLHTNLLLKMLLCILYCKFMLFSWKFHYIVKIHINIFESHKILVKFELYCIHIYKLNQLNINFTFKCKFTLHSSLLFSIWDTFFNIKICILHWIFTLFTFISSLFSKASLSCIKNHKNEQKTITCLFELLILHQY